MRKKLFLYSFTAAILAVVLTGVIAFVIMQNSIIEEAKISANSIANMLVNVIEASDEDYDETAKSLKQEVSAEETTSYRITIISGDGKVLGDSDTDIALMDNHADRPEVVAAVQSGVGSARRDSSTLNTNMLYVAVKDEQSDLIVRVALPLFELRRMSLNLLIGCLISILVGGAASLLAAFWFAGRLAKPIKKLARAANEISDTNMDISVKLNSNTELDSLAQDFNQMSLRLKNSIGELKHKNSEFDAVLSSMEDGLIAVDSNQKVLYINPVVRELFGISKCQKETVYRLSELVYKKPILNAVKKCIKQNENQQLVQKIGLEEVMDYKILVYPMRYKNELSGAIIIFRDITHVLELEKLRSDFVANVSHELRTPLTSIKGYAQALKDEGLSDIGKNTRFLEIIEIEADRLNILINDLMALSKIENQSEDTDIFEHDLNEIVDEVAALIDIRAKERDIRLIIDIPKDLKVFANKDRMKQLLLNLMDNGIKYNKKGGELKVLASEQKGMLNIIVSDTGVGIDQKDIVRLFERFYRVEKSRSKELGGTGLGLSIVKHIAELYGGSATVSSKKGEGTEVVVTMPISRG